MTKNYLKKATSTLWLWVFTVALAFNAKAQCPTGAVVLYSQAAINEFALNFPNCTEITGNLYIGPGNLDAASDITDVSPLGNITKVTGTVYIQNNAVLQNLDGLKINTITGRLFIGGDNLTNTNAQLQNINGLSHLTTIGAFLQIVKNPLLTDINGLSNLTSVAQDIEIADNNVLADVSALQNTTFHPNEGYGLSIVNNPALSVCSLPNFCGYLENPASSHPRNITGNLTDCMDEAAVVAACALLSVNEPEVNKITLFPNPVKEMLYFSEEVSQIKITDLSGRTVKPTTTKGASINLSHLSGGIYIITATTFEGKKVTRKIIKE